MKSLTKAIAVASLASVSTAAMAVEGLSTTIGLVSDYNYRGVNLGDAGATVSVDYTTGGFYVGVWAINDGNGTADADWLQGQVKMALNMTRTWVGVVKLVVLK